MELKCRCGNICIKTASNVLLNIEKLYDPCKNCNNVILKKFKPLTDQINLETLENDFKRCECGKRHLDIVIAHALKIMIDEDLKDRKSALRNACTPLITPAYPLNSVPYLKEDSLVILSDKMDKNCAGRIVNEVSEIKGVLKGDLRETVGMMDVNSTPNVYELLAGCDMRCDIVQTSFGAVCVYKHQSEIHIEFPKPVSPKIEILKKVLAKYENPKILDCTCGPGTLGITCLKAGAENVVFNDIWYPAAKLTALNLEVNGFPVKFSGDKKGLIAFGDNFEIYCMDIMGLKEVLDEEFDICIIDVFPGVDSKKFVEAASELGNEIVLI